MADYLSVGRNCAWMAALAAVALCDCRREAPLQAPRVPITVDATDGRPTGALVPHVGTGRIDDEIRLAQRGVALAPTNNARMIGLATLFFRKARESEDGRFTNLAQDAVDRVLARAPDDLPALRVRAAIFTEEHRFREARDLAERLVRRAPQSSDLHALVSDSCLELGEYPCAIEAAQRMLDVRPDGGGYVRAAWLRWLHGDPEGAAALFRLALDALPRSADGRAWIIGQAAQLAFNTNDHREAERLYRLALDAHPTSSDCLAGLARVLVARGALAEARSLAERAVARRGAAEHHWLLGEILEIDGAHALSEAAMQSAERIARRTDPRTFALLAARRGSSLDDAIASVQRERERRPDIFSDHALAWALHRAGRSREARDAIDRALRLGTRDASFHFHRAMILEALGERAAAIGALQRAWTYNPAWDPREARDAAALLRSWGAPLPDGGAAADAAGTRR